jgi:hypothetical protein
MLIGSVWLLATILDARGMKVWMGVNLKKHLITVHATETEELHSKKVSIHKDLIPMFEGLGKLQDLLINSTSQDLDHDSTICDIPG